MDASSLATSVAVGARPLSIEELAANAKVIVVGKIVAVTTSWNAERTQIITRVELQPEEVMEGVPSGDRISCNWVGG